MRGGRKLEAARHDDGRSLAVVARFVAAGLGHGTFRLHVVAPVSFLGRRLITRRHTLGHLLEANVFRFPCRPGFGSCS
jgi:hypothetical protein